MQGRFYSDTELLEPDWLMEGKVAFGGVTLVAGDGGLGKDLLGADWVARLTRDGVMPDGTAVAPGSAIMITPEDESNITTGPRLQAAGADMSRVLDLTFVERGYTSGVGGQDQFALPDDLPILRAEIKRLRNCRLVWISPLAEVSRYALTGNVTVRREIMTPLRLLARDTGVAIVVVHHVVASGKVAGSVAVVQAARSVLRVSEDPASAGERVVQVEKTNIADRRTATPIRYTFQGSGAATRVRYITDASQAAAEDPAALSGEPRKDTARWVVLRHLRGECGCEGTSCGGEITSQELYALTDMAEHTVRVTLKRLVDGGLAVRCERGLFKASVTSAPQQALSRRVTVTNGWSVTPAARYGA